MRVPGYYVASRQAYKFGIPFGLARAAGVARGDVISRGSPAVVGLGGAAGGTRLIEHSLYGVSRFDPASFGAGAALLLVVSIAACLVPMVRATAIDPAAAIHVE